MKGKGLIQFFAGALIIVSIYQLSFNFITKHIENQAQTWAEKKVLKGKTIQLPSDKIAAAAVQDSVDHSIKKYRNQYLDSIGNDNLFLGITYETCKRQQLNLGLDLKGGMNVVLQVSMRDLLRSLADNTNDPKFLKVLDATDELQKKESQKDYISIFIEAYRKDLPGVKLSNYFATKDNFETIKSTSTDDEVIKVLNTKAAEAFDRTYKVLRTRIDKFGVTQPSITAQPATGRVIVELPGADNPARVRKYLQASAKLEFWETYPAFKMADYFKNVNTVLAARLTPSDSTSSKDSTKATGANPLLSSNTDSLKNKTATTTDSTKLTGASALAKAGTKSKTDSTAKAQKKIMDENPFFSVLEVPQYQSEKNQTMIAPGPIVGWVQGRDTAKVNQYLSLDFVKSALPPDVKFAWSSKQDSRFKNMFDLYALQKQSGTDDPPLDGSVVVNARQDVDQNNNVEVAMSMNAEGARLWASLTRKQVHKYDESEETGNGYIAIVLDGLVQSAPRVSGEITGGRSSITGGFTQQEAADLANILEAGKLPTPARIIAEEVVGPSLGAESIRAGITSMVIAFLCVLGFMIFYYSTSGIIANIALLFNLLFIIGILASISATLTMPGIAGIVLTMGMAVDANVLVHERIKEELAKGAALMKAINDGHTKSYSAIFDSNITVLLTGIILAYFGLGPVLGYATTLNIGIVMTLFTAVFVAHIIMEWWVKRGFPIKFKTRFSPNFTKYNIKFVELRKYSYIFSGTLALIGLISIFTKGFDYGVDFKGGRTYIVQFTDKVNSIDVRDDLKKVLGTEPVVKTYGTSNEFKITTLNTTQSEDQASLALYTGLKKYFPNDVTPEKFNKTYLLSSSLVGPTISNDIITGSVWAIILSLVAIGLYILIRFRNLKYSIGAIISLMHDVLMVMGAFSLLQGLLPFPLEVDEQFVAAALTVMGYSMNDTVVIFDRIREFLRDHPTMDMKKCVNDAINSTLNRTITTHLTVLIVLLILFFFGGEVLRGFSFALIIGVVFGTYSSIFVATPLVIDLTKDEKTIRVGQPAGATPKKSVASKS